MPSHREPVKQIKRGPVGNPCVIKRPLPVLSAKSDVEDAVELLRKAVTEGRSDQVKRLLQQWRPEQCGINLKDKTIGNTLLIIAAQNGYVSVVEQLLLYGCDVTIHNYDNQTALEVCSDPIKQILLSAVERSTGHMTRKLLQAAWQGNARVIKKLLLESKTLDVNCHNGEKIPLILLIAKDIPLFERLNKSLLPSYQPAEVLELLLQHKANANVYDVNGKGVLHHVALQKTQNALLVAKVVLKNGSDKDAKDKDGCTALHYAALNGKTDMTQLLIESGADINAKNLAGKTPLHFAAAGGHDRVVNLLLENGADVTVMDSRGLNPSDEAKKRKLRETLKIAWVEAMQNKGDSGSSPEYTIKLPPCVSAPKPFEQMTIVSISPEILDSDFISLSSSPDSKRNSPTKKSSVVRLPSTSSIAKRTNRNSTRLSQNKLTPIPEHQAKLSIFDGDLEIRTTSTSDFLESLNKENLKLIKRSLKKHVIKSGRSRSNSLSFPFDTDNKEQLEINGSVSENEKVIESLLPETTVNNKELCIEKETNTKQEEISDCLSSPSPHDIVLPSIESSKKSIADNQENLINELFTETLIGQPNTMDEFSAPVIIENNPIQYFTNDISKEAAEDVKNKIGNDSIDKTVNEDKKENSINNELLFHNLKTDSLDATQRLPNPVAVIRPKSRLAVKGSKSGIRKFTRGFKSGKVSRSQVLSQLAQKMEDRSFEDISSESSSLLKEDGSNPGSPHHGNENSKGCSQTDVESESSKQQARVNVGVTEAQFCTTWTKEIAADDKTFVKVEHSEAVADNENRQNEGIDNGKFKIGESATNKNNNPIQASQNQEIVKSSQSVKARKLAHDEKMVSKKHTGRNTFSNRGRSVHLNKNITLNLSSKPLKHLKPVVNKHSQRIKKIISPSSASGQGSKFPINQMTVDLDKDKHQPENNEQEVDGSNQDQNMITYVKDNLPEKLKTSPPSKPKNASKILGHKKASDTDNDKKEIRPSENVDPKLLTVVLKASTTGETVDTSNKQSNIKNKSKVDSSVFKNITDNINTTTVILDQNQNSLSEKPAAKSPIIKSSSPIKKNIFRKKPSQNILQVNKIGISPKSKSLNDKTIANKKLYVASTSSKFPADKKDNSINSKDLATDSVRVLAYLKEKLSASSESSVASNSCNGIVSLNDDKMKTKQKLEGQKKLARLNKRKMSYTRTKTLKHNILSKKGFTINIDSLPIINSKRRDCLLCNAEYDSSDSEHFHTHSINLNDQGLLPRVNKRGTHSFSGLQHIPGPKFSSANFPPVKDSSPKKSPQSARSLSATLSTEEKKCSHALRFIEVPHINDDQRRNSADEKELQELAPNPEPKQIVVKAKNSNQVIIRRPVSRRDDTLNQNELSVSGSGDGRRKDTIYWKKGNLLGKGGFGTVWCALTNSGQLIAVKQVQLNIDNRRKAEREYQKIQEEVSLLSVLHHKNIVGFLGTCLDNSTVNIFMEFIPGGSIANILARFGALDESVFCHYAYQILKGIAYLHENNIIHRDIKGGNVMLMPNGVIKLIDFGCAKKVCMNIVTNRSMILKSMKGTPYWMAPEVISETGHGKKSDIWSIGCTVFEMATRKPPWASMAPMVAILAINSDGLIPQLPEKFSSEARDFVKICMTREQDLRPSAVDLLNHSFIINRSKHSSFR